MVYGWNVVVVGMLLPNGTGGYDQTELPHTSPADPILATIRFEAIYQCYPDLDCCSLDLPEFWPGTDDCHFANAAGGWILTNMTAIVNGTYCMNATWMPGKMIDVYTQYPYQRYTRGQ